MSTRQFQRFSASWEPLAKVITGIVVVMLAFVVFSMHSVVWAGITAALLLLAYAWSPQGYEIRDRTLVIRRLAGNVRIPLGSIRQARVAGGDDLSGWVRLFGSGGLFGWYGLFRTPKLGRSTWYVTNRDNTVVLVTETKTIVVSPDDVNAFLNVVLQTADPEEFVQEIRQQWGGRS